MSKKIRTGDHVIVLSGNEKGKKGVVLSRSGEFALVQDINKKTSYIKKSQEYPQGQLRREEAPIRLCKLRVCGAHGKPIKLRTRVNEQGVKEHYYIDNGQIVVHRAVKKLATA